MALYNKKGKVSFYSVKEVEKMTEEVSAEARREIRKAKRAGREIAEEAQKEVRKAQRSKGKATREAQESVREADRYAQQSIRDAQKAFIAYLEFDATRTAFERQPYVQVHSLLGKIEKMMEVDPELRKKFPKEWEISDEDLCDLEERCQYYVQKPFR